jgi:hypothetical protein
MANIAVEHIARQAENLPPPDYIELIEKLVHQLHNKRNLLPEKLDWQELYGLGKGLWADEDAQEYVNRLREDRQ